MLDFRNCLNYVILSKLLFFNILIAKDQIILRKLIDLNVEHNAELNLYDV